MVPRLQRLRSAARRFGSSERRFPSGWDDWHRRRRAAEHCFRPWVERALPLAGRTVLEYGCGNGAATAAFAPGATRYIGFDISDTDVADARRILAEGGLHPTLVSAPPDRILDEVKQLQGEIDVFLCYAVLEHMTLDERLVLLEMSREVVRDDGIIVIIETPNRLTPWDYHTSQLPFMNQLPEEIALRYLDRSPRGEFLDAMRTASAAGRDALREAFTRWGRGMSFHELELVYEDLPLHVVGCSWEPVLLPERAVYREELALQRVLDRARPDLPPSFSRYWLDIILTPRAQPAPARFLRPWALRTAGSVAAYYDGAEVVHLPVAESMLAVDLGCPSDRLLVMMDVPDDDVVLRVRQPATGREIEAVPSGGEHSRFAEVRLPEPSDRYEVRLSRPGWVTLVAYEG